MSDETITSEVDTPPEYKTADPPAPVEVDATEQPAEPTTPTFKYDADAGVVHTPAGQKLKVLISSFGAPIFRDPTGKINKGKPTSAWDVLWEQCPPAGKLRGGKNPQHAVPRLDDEGDATGSFELKTAAALYAEEQKAPGRGKKVQVTLEQARLIKDDYYAGNATQAGMAGQKKYGGISEATINRIITGRSLWYA